MKTTTLAGIVWPLCIGIGIVAGCAARRPDAVKAATRPRLARLNEKAPAVVAVIIARSEGVPDGVVTESGLTVPRGFTVNVFADGLENPRRICIAPGGTPAHFDVFVAESKPGRLRVLRAQGGATVAEKFVFTDKLRQPYGIAFHRSGFLYVGNTDSIVRFPYVQGQTSSNVEPQKIADLTEGGYNQHWTRNLLFSRDGAKLYVTVGSSCNVCEETDSQRAAISVMNPDGSARRVFASGMRNPVGLTWRPGTDDLWTVVNERDRLGDDVPPDYLTRVADGSFHGWPYAYTLIDGTVTPDPNFGDRNPAKLRATVPPDLPVQAHSAALGVTFYPLASAKGAAAFPLAYAGDAFLSYHGSWNRSKKTGYKITRAHFRDGKVVAVSDFVTGFLHDDGTVWGRPVDVVGAPDGSLLFSDDMGGKIWRVSYGAVAEQSGT